MDYLYGTTWMLMTECKKDEPVLRSLLSALAAPALGWTTEKPKVPGWYWYWCDGQENKIIVYVDKALSIEQGGWFVTELTGQFAGPLEVPT